MVLQKDVAAACGVSQATVSRALNNDPRITKDVCERIQRIAREMGYVINPTLQTLSGYRWAPGSVSLPNIAIIIASPTDVALGKRPRFMHARATELGYNVSPFSLRDYPNRDSLRRVLKARGVRGLIFDTWTAACGSPEEWLDYACVAAGNRLVPCPFDSVIFDHYLMMRTALEGLIERGYRKIAVFLVHTPSPRDDDLRSGAIEGVRQRAAPAASILSAYIPFPHAESGDFLAEFVKREKPDAVIGFNEREKVMLEERGFRVSEDFVFLAIHNARDDPKLAAPVFKEEELSIAAVDRLHIILRAGKKGIPHYPCTINIAVPDFSWHLIPRKPDPVPPEVLPTSP